MNQANPSEKLSDGAFERLALFIEDYCGIQITPKKRTMVEARLQRRMRALAMTHIDDYCALLFSGDYDEGVAFINAMTTNKTDFFREKVHFDFVAETIMPELARNGRRNAKFWSAASSTGAGAYSGAMISEDFRRQTGMDYSILATDISTDVLRSGIAGRYPLHMMEPIPSPLRQRYVMRSRDPRCKEFRIVPELRQKVDFLHLNLMDRSYPVAKDFDVIICRNILIYFDHATQVEVLKRLTAHLRPGGYLITGHSETVRGFDLPLRPVYGGTIHQRIDREIPQLARSGRQEDTAITAYRHAS